MIEMDDYTTFISQNKGVISYTNDRKKERKKSVQLSLERYSTREVNFFSRLPGWLPEEAEGKQDTGGDIGMTGIRLV